MTAQTRAATVVLVDRDGGILGQLPVINLGSPWLQEVSDLVEQARLHYQLNIFVLRLLSVEDGDSAEICATYLAELQAETATTANSNEALAQLQPWSGKLSKHPLRLPYAQVGGPSADLYWAYQQIKNTESETVTGVTQLRTWNLSCIWQLDTYRSTYWLKVVPPFFQHEAQVINLLSGEAVPSLVADEGNRILMRNIPGEDCYDASEAQMRMMIELLVDLQWRWRTRLNDPPAGMWDWRDESLVSAIGHALDCCEHELERAEYVSLSAFVDSLPERLHQLSQFSIPISLVHGDFHPGNWRGIGNNLTILDWGDCGIGNVLLDVPGLLDRVPTQLVKTLEQHWLSCWQKYLPDSDVEQAFRIIKPISTARMAATYQIFLDNIEPSEQVYHDSDPAMCLRNTLVQLT